MDQSIGSPRTRSVVGVRGPGVSVFGLPLCPTEQERFFSATVVSKNFYFGTCVLAG